MPRSSEREVMPVAVAARAAKAKADAASAAKAKADAASAAKAKADAASAAKAKADAASAATARAKATEAARVRADAAKAATIKAEATAAAKVKATLAANAAAASAKAKTDRQALVDERERTSAADRARVQRETAAAAVATKARADAANAAAATKARTDAANAVKAKTDSDAVAAASVAKTLEALAAAKAARDVVVANRAPATPVVAAVEPALSPAKAQVAANNVASLAQAKAATRAANTNVAPTGSLLKPDAGLFGTGAFGPAPELSAPELPAAVSTSPITAGKQAAFNTSIAPIVAKNTAINTQNDTVYAGGNNTFDETAGGVSFKSNITPTPQVSSALSGMFNIPTAEEKAGFLAQAETAAAKVAANKAAATAQTARDTQVQNALANIKPETGAAALDRILAGGQNSLISLEAFDNPNIIDKTDLAAVQASPAYANMTLEAQEAIVASAVSGRETQAEGAQEAKDFWATQDYDPNKYKVAPDASFGEKITGLARVSDSVFQSIASGNVPKGAIGQYAGMAQLGNNLMPTMGELGAGAVVGVGGGMDMTGASPITQYMAQNSIPPYLDIPNSSTSAAAGLEGHDDTNRLYMNTGEDLSKKYPNMAGKGQEDGYGWIIPEGGGTIGAYDIQFLHDPYNPKAGGPGFVNDVLMPVASAVMGFYNPAFAVAQVATKAAAGETLHLGDYASAITGGLKASGMLTAPTKAVAATATTPAIAAKAGTGLFNNAFTYEQSIKGLNTAFAIADGDIIGGVVSQFGDVLTEKALNTVGLNKTVLNGLNINQDDLVQGMLTTEKELLKGASFDDALLKGVGKYIVEGGSLSLGIGGIQTPEFIKAIGNAVKDVGSAIDDAVLQPIKNTMPAVEDAVRAAGSAIDDAAQPLIQVAKDVADPIVEAGSAINREVVKPTIQAVEAVGKPVEQGIRAVNEAVVAPTVQAAIDAGSAVNREAVKPVVDVIEDVLGSTYDAINQLDNFIDDIDLPSFNLPNINLPSFNFPNLNYSGGGNSLGISISGGQPTQRASLMPKKDLNEIDLGFELDTLERAKQFDRPQYKTQGIYGI